MFSSLICGFRKYTLRRAITQFSLLILILLLLLLLLLHGAHGRTHCLRVWIHTRQVLEHRLEELGIIHDLRIILVLVVHIHLFLGSSFTSLIFSHRHLHRIGNLFFFRHCSKVALRTSSLLGSARRHSGPSGVVRVHAHGERTLQQCLLARLFPLTRGCWHCSLCFTASLCLLPRPLLLHRHSKCKRQLRVVIGVDPKLKSAAASARDASATAILTLHNRGRHQSITEMRSRWNCHQVRPSSLFSIDRCHKLVQHVSVRLVLPKVDNVDVDLLLFQLLGQLDHLLLVGFNWRANKGNNPSLVILALPVLERQVGDFNSRDEPHVPRGSHLVQLCQYFASVSGEGDQDCQVSEGHQGHVGLRVGPGL